MLHSLYFWHESSSMLQSIEYEMLSPKENRITNGHDNPENIRKESNADETNH